MEHQINITLNRRVLKLVAAISLVVTGLIIGMAVSATQVNAQATTVEDTTYTAITPCASFDSRSDTGALANQFTSGESRTYQITGTAPADQQNGINCGIPDGADAVLINIVAIQPQSGGNLRAYATGDTGTGGVVNYSPVTPNLNNSNAVVIPLSATGQLDIENNCGGCANPSIDARGVLLGYFTDDLAARVAQLETLLADITRDNGGPNGTDRLLFTGMNLQLVDGTGDTPCTGDDLNGGTTGGGEPCNGQGNLIIGYNEDNFSPETRTGTHSVIVGEEHTWTSSGHLVAGFSNNATNRNASVIAGQGNTADGLGGVVIGGQANFATGEWTSVTGGRSNTANGDWSSVSAGQANTAEDSYSSVSGGQANRADGAWSSVSGGVNNTAKGNYSAVTGGRTNNADGSYSAVSGGNTRSVTGTDDWRAGSLFETD